MDAKPTGVKRSDVAELGRVEFEGESAQLYYAEGYTRSGGEEFVVVYLDTGSRKIAISGYYDGEGLMEIRREPID